MSTSPRPGARRPEGTVQPVSVVRRTPYVEDSQGRGARDGTDSMQGVHTRAVGLNAHKIEITASVGLANPRGATLTATRECSALPAGLRALTHQYGYLQAIQAATAKQPA